MINMTVPTVNLLPWREDLKKRRNSQFYTLSGITGATAVVVVGMGWLVMSSILQDWKSDSEYLVSENVMLDKQIQEIKDIKAQTQALLSRKSIIESLQDERGQTVNMFRQLAVSVPDGVVLRGVKTEGLKVSLNGFSQSNAKISALMKALEEDPVFEGSKLVESKASAVGGRKVYEFQMTVMLTKTKEDSQDKAGEKNKAEVKK